MAYRPAQVWTGSAWDDIGDKRVGIQEINTQTANYTLVLADIAKRVQMNNSAARTITIPPNSSVAFPVGTRLDIGNINTGVLTIAGGAGVTVNGRALTLGQWETATVVQRAANTWVVEPQANLTAALGSKVVYPSGGSDGNVLTKSGTAAAWSAPEAAGLTLITSESFSAVSSVSINGCFTSTYHTYAVNLGEVSVSTDNDLLIRFRAAGSDNASTNYEYYEADGASFARSQSQTSFRVGNSGGYARLRGQPLFINGPEKSDYVTNVHYSYLIGAGSTVATRRGSGQMTVTTSYDGFTLFLSAGTISGVVRVYGYKD
jgi:hypothetical protein